MIRRATALVTFGLAALAVVSAFGQPSTAPGEGHDAMMDRIERDSESVITGRHFTYDPAGRRDPFEPLVRATPTAATGKRPKGIAGMLVSEIDLKGIVIDARGYPAALFSGSDNRGYTLRVGDVVYDGRVLSIDPDRGVVVFRQNVDDPRRIKPYRDVIKRLYPSDEDLVEEDEA
ncbi:MAG: hypothetical protein Q9Q40_13005 [Acidobacteriota bacterium]|nr:hypothetical protein [Acidobacteriota bacterium]MDQ7087192.1 hypothetical protein [Acidobacteriota bacterium]